MRILFCGGGTAGHVTPAIAMAEIMLRARPDCEVAFVGRSGGNENRSIVKEGYRLYTIDIMGIKRSLSFRNISAIIKVIKSGRMAKEIISEFSPDIVIGTGGYVCYPVIRAAQRLHIPTMIHESNVYPGLVTRLLGGKCTRLLLNSEGTKGHLKHTENTLVIGNPLRTSFSSVSRDDARKRLGIGRNNFLVLSFGGSLGSEVMNERIIELMRGYSSARDNVSHVHATGISHYGEIRSREPALCSGANGCRILPYIDDMPSYLKAADLVICRSGAMTVSELALVGVASILIPSPNVSENHQYTNAKYVSDRGAALMIEERDLSLESLAQAVERVRTDSASRRKMAEKMRRLSRLDTAKLLVRAVNEAI